MKTLVVIDFCATLYSSIFKHTNLSYMGSFTGGVFGFLKSFSKLVTQYDADDVIVCLDCPPYTRKEMFDGYKSKRKKDPEITKRFEESQIYCFQLLEKLGVTVWGELGSEADDLIYLTCRYLHERYDMIVISCGDDDLYQCFKYPGVFLNKKTGLYGKADYEKEHEISLDDWVKFCTITGTHNDIPGIVGLGPKKAAKIILGGKYDELYKEHKEELDLYTSLIQLPIKRYEVPEIKKVKTDLDEVRSFMESLAIQQHPAYERAFKRLGGSRNLPSKRRLRPRTSSTSSDQ